MSNHTLYKRMSPTYQSILARYGRMLTPALVEGVLREHSLSVEDYILAPEVGLTELPAQTDAADLLAWLGY